MNLDRGGGNLYKGGITCFIMSRVSFPRLPLPEYQDIFFLTQRPVLEVTGTFRNTQPTVEVLRVLCSNQCLLTNGALMNLFIILVD